MDSPLFNTVYTSSAVELFNDAELETLLRVARHNNELRGVTGMLLYSDGVFIQALEGEKDQVMATYRIIEQDSRHRGLIILSQSSIEVRSFSGWAMGFKVQSRGDLVSTSGFTDFLSKDFDGSSLKGKPSVAMKLLQGFKGSMAG